MMYDPILVPESRLSEARTYWTKTQARFDEAIGSHRDSKLRTMMRTVSPASSWSQTPSNAGRRNT